MNRVATLIFLGLLLVLLHFSAQTTRRTSSAGAPRPAGGTNPPTAALATGRNLPVASQSQPEPAVP